MPVPTPRTNSIPTPVEEPVPLDPEEDEDIPEDWKDTGEIIEIKRLNKPLKIEESVTQSQPWTQTIPEEPEDQPPKSHDESEINVKEMKEFWEVATSPIKLSPVPSPARSPPLWKSMPNLAKDMATQTTITESSSSSSSSSSESETEESVEVTEVTAKLVPIEERKKAFIQAAPLPWKSMPSLNKGVDQRTQQAPPLPLVGSCYPSKLEDITLEQPLKQIKSVFEKKHVPVEIKVEVPEKPKGDQEKMKLEQPEISTNEEMEDLPLEETNLSTSASSSTAPVVYRWDDESNGEIYTDKPILDEVDNETTTSDSIGLYVVENGREYPLVPLKERKSLFENKQVSKVSTPFKPLVKEIKVKSTVENAVLEVEEQPVANHKPKMEKKTEVVKSSVMPYIIEEQEVLQNINLVSRIKTKFANGEK